MVMNLNHLTILICADVIWEYFMKSNEPKFLMIHEPSMNSRAVESSSLRTF